MSGPAGAHVRAGAAFAPFRFRVEPVKIAEFARAVGAVLATLPGGAVVAPVGYLFFVTAQDPAAVFGEMGLGWADVLLGGVSLRYARPVLAGEVLSGATHVVEARRRDGVTVARLETRYRDERGGVPLVEVSTLVAGARPPAPAPAPGPEPGGLRHAVEVSRMAIAWMAVAIEDPNPVHVDDAQARLAGLPTAIAHGTFPLGAAGAMLTRAYGAAAVRALDLRLTAPAFPAETVVATGVPAGEEGAVDVTVRAGGRVVARGRAEVAPA